MPKPKIGIFSFTCCEGCQLEIVNCEDELLDIVGAVEIVSFGMAQSNNLDVDMDIAFVEGTIVQPREVEDLKKIRERSNLLIAIGACATYGGVAAIDRDRSRDELKKIVYGEDGAFIPTIKPSPLYEHVKVDFSIQGCPIEKHQFIKAVGYLLHGDLPILPDYPVCTECKRKENECVLVHHKIPCLGPITRAGCDARCPSHYQGCDGCFGPIEEANVAMEYNVLREMGIEKDEIARMVGVFATASDSIGDFLKGKDGK